MSNGQIARSGPGAYRLTGELSFTTVPQVWAAARRLIAEDAGSSTLHLDLAGVERADSAGVALLLEWLREARRQGRHLRLDNVPAQMQAIARVSGLEELIAAAGEGAESG